MFPSYSARTSVDWHISLKGVDFTLMKCVAYDSKFALDIETKHKAAVALGSQAVTKRTSHPKKPAEGPSKGSEGRRRGSYKKKSKPLLPGSPSSPPMEPQSYDSDEDDGSGYKLSYP